MRAFLDASEITIRCQRMSRTPAHNELWSAEVRLASQYATGITEGGTELIITDNAGSTVLHAGPCWYGEDDGDANDQFTSLNSFDHRVKWPWRQMMWPGDDYSDPTIFQVFGNAPEIMEAAIDNNVTQDGAYGITVGSVTPSTIPLVGFKPSNFPWTLEYLWNFLVDTGELDVMLNPAAGGASTVDLYPGNAGTDLSGSVTFDYNTGSFNCMGAKYTFDMKNTISRIRYFLGPKRPQYDGDIQHWAGDVQKDDPCLPGNSGDSGDPFPQCPSPPAGPGGEPGTDIGNAISAMEGVTGLMRDIQVFDSTPGPEGENSFRDLYYPLWQSEMLVRTVPRRLLSMVPDPNVAINFDVGDLITANAVIRGTVGGVQRVFKYTVEQDTEGNEILTSLITSADGMV